VGGRVERRSVPGREVEASDTDDDGEDAGAQVAVVAGCEFGVHAEGDPEVDEEPEDRRGSDEGEQSAEEDEDDVEHGSGGSS
jgi:hypothetical protein